VVRSPGFGSIRSDYFALFRLAFAMASNFFLNQATSYKSPAHSSTGTRSGFHPSHCLIAYGFMFFFTPLQGFFFTFPSRYCFTIGHSGVFSLTRWSSLIHTGFHVSHATRDKKKNIMLSTTGLSPSMVQDSTASSQLIFLYEFFPRPRFGFRIGLGCSPSARRY
jgi:hypothetical protein